jgi:hypothetical protein
VTYDASNSVPAEALTPELVNEGGGYQKVRVRLRTETGTIVYADLLPAEASAIAGRVGRLAYSAKANNDGLTAKANKWPASGSTAAKLVEVVRSQGGVWYPGRLERAAVASGARLSMDESGLMLWEMTKNGVLRSLGDSRFEVA